jgi:uncharacterized protein (TIGR04255 family)
MPFPESPRVIYHKNPLADVVCNFRFPPILRIDSETPYAFQERIRQVYPLYQEISSPVAALPAGAPPEIARLVQSLGSAGGTIKRHQFSSDDKRWEVTLSRENLSFKTNAYGRWEEFRERFAIIFNLLVEIYNPTACTQVSLRYLDIIKKSILGLDHVPWAQLLKPHIAGLLSVAGVAERVDNAVSQAHLRLDDTSDFLTIKCGIRTIKDSPEPCFIIDGEFHTHGRREQSDVLATLDGFHRCAGHFFRWCIEQRLHDALEPEPA